MFIPNSLIGQWAGSFEYGPEYGEHLWGEKVNFRLYIDIFIDGQFSGDCVDIDGIGTDFEKSKITGFVNGDFISFTKIYSYLNRVDEHGNTVPNSGKGQHTISYEGEYDHKSKMFAGIWEIETEIEQIGDRVSLEICSGKWEITKDD